MSTYVQPFSTSKIYYNSMSKTYLDHSKQLILATKPIFRESGWEPVVSFHCCSDTMRQSTQKMGKILLENGRYSDEKFEEILDIAEMSVWQLEELEAKDAANLARAMRRARVQVRDYCLSTPMAWFVTLTLDPRKVDRYDVAAMTRKLNMWLNHMVTRRGLAYVMIPELHKDGAIHYHALMTDCLEAVDSGTIIPSGQDRPRRPINISQRCRWLQHGGRVVYNLPEWPYGYTTALRLSGNYEHAVNYVCKYITKGHDDLRAGSKVGGRWYYHGGKLGKPVIEYYDSDFENVREMAGEAAHIVDVSDRLSGVEMMILWQQPDGQLRAKRR